MKYQGDTSTVSKYTLQTLAHHQIAAAVRRGELVGLSVHFDAGVPCVDCGKPAQCYDHRDYLEPLDVDPVCVKCNQDRGPAMPVNFQKLIRLIRKRKRHYTMGWIADQVGIGLSTISEIKHKHGREPRYTLGAALVELEMETRPRK